MQHEVAAPHIVLTTTQTLVAVGTAIIGLVAGAWKVGREMGAFAQSQNNLATEVKTGFTSISGTLKEHSESIHRIRNKQQEYEVEHALLAQHTNFRQKS